ncbi:hypothetical protein [Maribacter sp.]|uniref:hypothetical protein n=1 Tax=Maribacter sp. TaxID=1897614 RepID=UPI0025B855C2|nr:hypothetical protein [Maribacter sp.]
MKKHQISLLSIFLLICLSACNNDDTNNNLEPGQLSYLIYFENAEDFDFDSGASTLKGTAYPEGNTLIYHSGTNLIEYSNNFEAPMESIISNNILAFDEVEKLAINFELMPKNVDEINSIDFSIVVFYNNEEDPIYFNNVSYENIAGSFAYAFTYSLDKGVELESRTN